MKLNFLLVLSLLLSASAFGQAVSQSTENQSLTILEKKWSVKPGQVLVVPGTSGYRQLSSSPVQDAKAIQRKERFDETKTKIGLSIQPETPMESSRMPDRVYQTVDVYSYRATFRNDSTKIIKEIIWEYVFSDPVTNQEQNRIRIISHQKITPGKMKKLEYKYNLPPSRIINASANGQYSEEIKIRRIAYSDGSVWLASN